MPAWLNSYIYDKYISAHLAWTQTYKPELG